jgi:trk system potassium uptake protein TrkA
MSRNSYAVFGLGSFGSKLALELSKAGHNVLVCDVNQNKVDDFCTKVAEAVVCDVSNPDTVRELNVSKFEAVILGMSSFFEKQVLALTLLKQEGAKRVLAKAVSDIQERILYRLGADEVIQPEKDVASRLARRLSMANISDIMDFKGSAIAEVQVPASLSGRTLRELDLRNRHNITVLLIRNPESAEETPPAPDLVLEKGDTLTVFGGREEIVKLFKKEN